MSTSPARRVHPRLWWRLLLIIPLVTLLAPWHARATPALLGVPFFYWYLMAWVPVSAILSGVAYFKTRDLI